MSYKESYAEGKYLITLSAWFKCYLGIAKRQALSHPAR